MEFQLCAGFWLRSNWPSAGCMLYACCMSKRTTHPPPHCSSAINVRMCLPRSIMGGGDGRRVYVRIRLQIDPTLLAFRGAWEPPLSFTVLRSAMAQPGASNFRDVTRATKFQKKFALPPNFADVLKDFTREVSVDWPTGHFCFLELIFCSWATVGVLANSFNVIQINVISI